MKIISYDGYVFAGGGYYPGLPWASARGQWTVHPTVLPRAGTSPVLGGTALSERAILVDFSFTGLTSTVDFEDAADTLLAKLDPANPTPRWLVAQRASGLVVRTLAIAVPQPGLPSDGSVNSVMVQFVAMSPYWEGLTSTIIPAALFTRNHGMALPNTGQARAAPIYKITCAVQRTTGFTSQVGWRFRRQVAVTNGTALDWVRRLVFVDLGDTRGASWAGGNALASGADVRVRLEGKDVNRHLVNWNTGRTFLAFLVTIPAGQSATYEIVYGNPAATSVPQAQRLDVRGGTQDSYAAPNLSADAGTATGGSGANLIDTGKAWETDTWKGGWVQIIGGLNDRRRIAGNNGTTITPVRGFATNATGLPYVVWMSGIAADGGWYTAIAGAVYTDSSQAWQINQWVGATVTNINTGATRTVLSNTATTLTLSSAFNPVPAINDGYFIERAGYLSWQVDESVYGSTWRGRWRIGHYFSKPERRWFGDQTPEGWIPNMYLPSNQDNFSQKSTDNYGAGGGSAENWRSNLRAHRTVRQNKKLPEQGLADGVMFYHPWGITGVQWDYKFKNVNAIGQFVTAVEGAGGEDWSVQHRNQTAVALLTNQAMQWLDLTAYGNVVRLYQGVLPFDEIAIPATVSKADSVEARDLTRIEVWLGLTGVTIGAVQAEGAVYDLNATLRLGGGQDGSLLPADRVVIGGAGHRVHVPIGQALWIRTDPDTTLPLLGIYNGSTLVQRAPYAALIYRDEAGPDGAAVALQSRAFMPLQPSKNTILNPTFAIDLANWSLNFTDPAATVTWTQDAAVYYDLAGSIKLNVTVDAVTVGNLLSAYQGALISCAPGDLIQFAGFSQTTTTGLEPDLSIYFYDVNQAQIAGGATQAAWPLLTGIWQPNAVTVVAPAGAAFWRPVLSVYNKAAGALGSVWFDQLTGGVPILWVSETAIGQLTVAAEFTARYGA